MRRRSRSTSDIDGRERESRQPKPAPPIFMVLHSATCKFDLNILICKMPRARYHHWALQLDNLTAPDGFIFEAQGCPPDVDLNMYQCRRFQYPWKVLKTVCLKEDFSLSMPAFVALAQAVHAEIRKGSDRVRWTSQDYILEILNYLEEECWLVDVDDDEYMHKRGKLEAMRGPVELVQRHVMAYPRTPSWDPNADADVDPLELSPPDSSSTAGHG